MSRRSRLHNLGWLDVLFFRYQQGDLKALVQARSIVFAWIKQSRHSADPLDWRDKIVGDRAGQIGYLARTAACNNLLNRAQAGVLIDSLERHASLLARKKLYSRSNHGLFMNTGLVLLAYYIPFHSGAREWNALGQRRFVSHLRRDLSDSGIWLEPSVGYHFLVTKLVQRFISFIPASQRQQSLIKLRTQMETMGRWFVMPDNLRLPFGDTILQDSPCWAIQPSPSGCDAIPPTNATGLMPSFDAGYAVVRNPPENPQPSYLGVTSSFFRKPHKHADDLSFDLFEAGHRIVTDTAHLGNDWGAQRRFASSDRAHNLLTADRGFVAARPTGNGLLATGHDATSGWYGILGQNNSLRRQLNVTERRLFLYLPGRALIVIDRATSSRKHTYTRYFGFGPDIAVSPAGGLNFNLSAPGFSGKLLDAGAIGGGRGRAAAVRGRRRPDQGFTYVGFHRRVPRWTVSYRATAKRAFYVAAISISDYLSSAQLSSASSSGSSFMVALQPTAGPAFTVTVTRNGGSLAISQSP